MEIEYSVRRIHKEEEAINEEPTIVVLEPVNDKMSLKEIALRTTPLSWRKVFEDAIDEYDHIEKIMEQTGFFPYKNKIFRAFELTPLDEVKVVIIGQDPYHQRKANGIPRAQGLSFSVSRGDEIPVSLKNIYKELCLTVEGFHMPSHGDLSSWAMQGVLLLNSSLTVPPSKPGGHGVIWHGLIHRLFEAISEVNPKCIYLLWGNQAKDIKRYIPETSIFLEAGHPSSMNRSVPFIGCNHFVKVNELLETQGKEPINWIID